MADSLQNRRFLPWLLLLPVLLLFLERWHTYSEPVERDITTYAVIGHEMLRGRQLYTDLWDHKPPAIHLTFALAEAVAGMGPLSLFLLNVLAALATLAGLYQAGKALGGGAGGLWAVFLWAVVSGDLPLQANQPNDEVFLNAFQTWAFALWLTARPQRAGLGRWLLIGALSALASLYKPLAVILTFLLALATLSLNWASSGRIRVFRQMALVFGCVLAAWGGLFGWFAFQGRWDDFKQAVLTYNYYYSGFHETSFGDLLRNIGGSALPFSTLAWLFLLFALGCLGAWGAGRKKEGRGPWLYWAVFAVAAELEVISPGRFFAHYNQLLMPPLILGGAAGAVWLGGLLKKRAGSWSWLPGAALTAFLVFHEAPFYRLSPEEWTRQEYIYGSVFIQSYQLGREINGLLEPGETFYEWGNESGLYFASRRSPPSGVFYSYPLLGNPLAPELCRRVVKDLEREKPELAVLNLSYYVSEDSMRRHPVLQWIRSHYRPLPGGNLREPFLLLLLKGGHLEKRIHSPSAVPASTPKS